MSPLDYCLRVQQAVQRGRPEPTSPLFEVWFADSGRAAQAVSLALEGRPVKAMDKAEKLARRYFKWMDL